MRRLLAVLVLFATPALAVDRFVQTNGGPDSVADDYCDGTIPQTMAQALASGQCTDLGPPNNIFACKCAFLNITTCGQGQIGTSFANGIGAGDTCFVAAGRYATGLQTITPKQSGTSAAAMVRYVCQSDQVEDWQSSEANRCILAPSVGGYPMDLRGKSYVEVDGFTFEPSTGGGQTEIGLWGVGQSGTVDCDPAGGTSNCSQGVVVKRVKIRDGDGGTLPFMHVRGWGGGRAAGNTLQDSDIKLPYWGQVTGEAAGSFFVGYSVGTTAAQETNTIIKNTRISGGRNTFTITDSKNLTLEDVRIWGAKNHETDWCNQTVFTGSTPGCENLTFNGVVFGPGVEFREPLPQTLGRIRNITIYNSVITGGWLMPSTSHDCDLTGTFSLRNSVIINLDSGVSTPTGHMNGGCTGAGCTQSCANPVTYDVDYNAYMFTPTTAVTTQFIDQRNKTCTGSPSSPTCTTAGSWTGTNLAGWTAATGMDSHSIALIAKDWDSTFTSVGSVTSAHVFGNNAPLWGAPDSANFSGTGFTNVNTRKFSSGDNWIGNLRTGGVGTGVFFEYDLDGTLLAMSSVVTTTNTNASCTGNQYCDNDVTFQPNIDRDGDGTFDAYGGNTGNFAWWKYADKPTGDRWVWIYGKQRDVNGDGTNDFTAGQAMPWQTHHTWAQVSTSPLIDIGDPLLCGDTALDGNGDGTIRCDIGPLEYGGTPPPVGNLHITIDDYTVTETGGTQTVNITVRQSDSSVSATNFSWSTLQNSATAGGSCAAGVDYITASGSGTFASGGTGPKTTTIGPITICGDSVFEAVENFGVLVTGFTNATDTVVVDDGQAVVAISNDDAAPAITCTSPSGAENVTPQTFTCTLAAAAGQTITLDYRTAGASATADVDFTSAQGTLTFVAGDTSEAINVTIINDGFVEPTEVYNMAYLNGQPAGVAAPASGTGTITDDDSAPSVMIARGLSLRGGKLNNGPAGAVTLATGTATLVGSFAATDLTNCPANSGLSVQYPCTVLDISGCGNVVETRRVRVYIGSNSPTAPALGTVTAHGGGRGTSLWQNAHVDNATAVAATRAAGYRFVQIVWDGPAGWNSDILSADYATNERYVACRPATVYKYIYDNYVSGTGTPLCAMGASGGGEGIAYTLTSYGGGSWISAAYLGSSPYGTRLDLACEQAPLTGSGTCESLYGVPETALAGKGLLNEAMGDPDTDSDGTDDCTEADNTPPSAAISALWKAASLAYATGTCPDQGTYYFANTWVTMNTGSLDSICTCTSGNCTNAPNHADLYHDELDNSVRGGATTCHATQTQLDQNVLTGVGHTINENTTGVNAWRDWIFTAPSTPNKCKIWP